MAGILEVKQFFPLLHFAPGLHDKQITEISLYLSLNLLLYIGFDEADQIFHLASSPLYRCMNKTL